MADVYGKLRGSIVKMFDMAHKVSSGSWVVKSKLAYDGVRVSNPRDFGFCQIKHYNQRDNRAS